MKDLFQIINSRLLQKKIVSSRKLYENWSLIPQHVVMRLLHEDISTQEWKQLLIENLRGMFDQKVMSFLESLPSWYSEGQADVEYWKKKGGQFISYWEDSFPIQLKYINDPPVGIYCMGQKKLLRQTKSILAFVGTRIPSAYGVSVTKRLMWECGMCGIITISGLADGIDSLVLKYSHHYKVHTIAVVPVIKEEHIELAKQNKDIVIISENPLFTDGPTKWQFIERNRLIAGLSIGTVVIEAPIKSGALITADFASGYHRYVFYFQHAVNNFHGLGGIIDVLHQPDSITVIGLSQILREISIEKEQVLIRNIKEFIINIIKKIHILDEKDIHIYNERNIWYSLHQDLKPIFWNLTKRNLNALQTLVIELKRLDIIYEFKGKILLNLLYAP